MIGKISAVPALCVGADYYLSGLPFRMVAGGGCSWVDGWCGFGGVVAFGFRLGDLSWCSVAILYG